MIWPFNIPVWFYPKPIDFRKQQTGLVLLIADQLKLDPSSGQLFLFRNQHANKIKLLFWDRNGFWLCSKKLEQGRLKFPAIDDSAMQLTTDQLNWLLSGLDITKQRLLPEVRATNYY